MDVTLKMGWDVNAPGYGMAPNGPREVVDDVIIRPERRIDADCTRKTAKGDVYCSRLSCGCAFTEMRSKCHNALF